MWCLGGSHCLAVLRTPIPGEACSPLALCVGHSALWVATLPWGHSSHSGGSPSALLTQSEGAPGGGPAEESHSRERWCVMSWSRPAKSVWWPGLTGLCLLDAPSRVSLEGTLCPCQEKTALRAASWAFPNIRVPVQRAPVPCPFGWFPTCGVGALAASDPQPRGSVPHHQASARDVKLENNHEPPWGKQLLVWGQS